MKVDLERELIHKCEAGQTRFYEPLVRAYEPSGIRLAFIFLGNINDAQDALQEAFIKAYRSLSQFDLERSFGPWFFQILRNQCRDVLRDRKSHVSLEELNQEDLKITANIEAGPERDYECNATAEQLWKGLRRIGEEHREILILKELEGFSYAELASILNIPKGTVASRLYHARCALREILLGLRVKTEHES